MIDIALTELIAGKAAHMTNVWIGALWESGCLEREAIQTHHAQVSLTPAARVNRRNERGDLRELWKKCQKRSKKSLLDRIARG